MAEMSEPLDPLQKKGMSLRRTGCPTANVVPMFQGKRLTSPRAASSGTHKLLECGVGPGAGPEKLTTMIQTSTRQVELGPGGISQASVAC